MTDTPQTPVPLHLIEIEPDGWCDAATGVCTNATPEFEAPHPASPSERPLGADVLAALTEHRDPPRAPARSGVSGPRQARINGQ